MDVILTRPGHLGHWWRIFRLYRRAFPAAERKTFSVIMRMYRRGKSDVWCIRSGGRLAGFAATVNGENLILLDYLAVDDRCRGRGVGTRALKALRRCYPGKGVFVEIESTRRPAVNRAERQKRKQFYVNCDMIPMDTEAEVFGVEMELLGWDCHLDFEEYRRFYREHYSPWAAEHIKKAE